MLFDDFVFMLRNKAYGAYLIRKRYKKTVVLSLFSSVIITLLLLTVQFVLDFNKQKNERLKISPRIIAAELIKIDISELKPKEIIQPPKKEEIPTPEVNLVKDSAVVTDSMKNKTDTTLNEHKTKELKNEQNIPKPSGPKFVCGSDLLPFRIWFMKNFKFPDNTDIRKSEGRIMLNFTINKNGLIDSAWIDKGIDPIIDKEVLRVIMSSPLWEPCIFEGKQLKQLYQLPIYLVKR